MSTVDEIVENAAKEFSLTEIQRRNLRRRILAALNGQPPTKKIHGKVGRAFYHVSDEMSGRPRQLRRIQGRL